MGEKEKKVTRMVLKVDLQCCRCYKKVKKVLCKFPQIRDQVYDEKANTVTITVVCCSPEKIRDKICCKGGISIQSIEIIPPPPPKKDPPPAPPPTVPPPVPPPTVPPPAQPQVPPPAKPPTVPPPAQPPVPPPAKPPTVPPPAQPPVPPPAKPPTAPPPAPPPVPPPATPPKDPPPAPPPPPDLVPPRIGFCCTECYHGHGGGPCHFGRPPPPPCYETYGRPVYDSWGGGCGYKYDYKSRGECFSDENPQGCSVM